MVGGRGARGLRVTGCTFAAYLDPINSPLSLACWLSTSVSQQGPFGCCSPGAQIWEVRGRGSKASPGQDYPPSLVPELGGGGGCLAKPPLQAAFRVSNRLPVMVIGNQGHRG